MNKGRTIWMGLWLGLGVLSLVPSVLPSKAEALCMAIRRSPEYYRARRLERRDLEGAVRLYRRAATTKWQEKTWIAGAYRRAAARAQAAADHVRAATYFQRALSAYPTDSGAASGYLRSMRLAGRGLEALESLRGFDPRVARYRNVLLEEIRIRASIGDKSGAMGVAERLRRRGRLRGRDRAAVDQALNGYRLSAPGPLGDV